MRAVPPEAFEVARLLPKVGLGILEFGVLDPMNIVLALGLMSMGPYGPK